MAMDRDSRTTGLGQDLARAIEDLGTTLQHATDATAVLRGILPRIDAIAGVFDDIETALRTGRERLGAATAAFGGHAYGFEPRPRPTLVVPQETAEVTPVPQGAVAFGESPAVANDTDKRLMRIEIENAAGQLDLRAVDDAMSRHPDVNDVALLDYDGHRATLKLWVDQASSASDVETWLATEGALPDGHAFSVVGLDDVA